MHQIASSYKRTLLYVVIYIRKYWYNRRKHFLFFDFVFDKKIGEKIFLGKNSRSQNGSPRVSYVFSHIRISGHFSYIPPLFQFYFRTFLYFPLLIRF